MLTILPMIVMSFLLPFLLPIEPLIEPLLELLPDPEKLWRLVDILIASTEEGIAEIARLVMQLLSSFI